MQLWSQDRQQPELWSWALRVRDHFLAANNYFASSYAGDGTVQAFWLPRGDRATLHFSAAGAFFDIRTTLLRGEHGLIAACAIFCESDPQQAASGAPAVLRRGRPTGVRGRRLVHLEAHFLPQQMVPPVGSAVPLPPQSEWQSISLDD